MVVQVRSLQHVVKFYFPSVGAHCGKLAGIFDRPNSGAALLVFQLSLLARDRFEFSREGVGRGGEAAAATVFNGEKTGFFQ